jgi:hypothetical protein
MKIQKRTAEIFRSLTITGTCTLFKCDIDALLEANMGHLGVKEWDYGLMSLVSPSSDLWGSEDYLLCNYYRKHPKD